MKPGSWASFQSALPPEARAGGEPDDGIDKSVLAAQQIEHDGEVYRCQFCGKEALAKEWNQDGNECPACGRMYDWILAQDEDDS
jgi:hypothetical protein